MDRILLAGCTILLNMVFPLFFLSVRRAALSFSRLFEASKFARFFLSLSVFVILLCRLIFEYSVVSTCKYCFSLHFLRTVLAQQLCDYLT